MKTIMILSVVLVLLTSGLATSDSVLSREVLPEHSDNESLFQDGFDKQECEHRCRSLYGASPYYRGGRGYQGGYYVLAQCMEDCDRRFWKEYDRKMRDLENE